MIRTNIANIYIIILYLYRPANVSETHCVKKYTVKQSAAPWPLAGKYQNAEACRRVNATAAARNLQLWGSLLF